MRMLGKHHMDVISASIQYFDVYKKINEMALYDVWHLNQRHVLSTQMTHGGHMN